EEIAFAEGLRRLHEGEPAAAAALAEKRLESSWWTKPEAPGGDVAASRWRAIEALARLAMVLAEPMPSLSTLEDVLVWYETSGWSVDAAYRQSELLRVTAGVVIDELDDVFHTTRSQYEGWLDAVLRATSDALAQPEVA